MTLVELINKYLKDNNLTKKEFAEDIGMNAKYVCAILRGDSNQSKAFIKAIKGNR